jgi:hypothetical protein
MLDLAIQHIITVQQGETLSQIAAQQGTSVAALAGANGISNPNLIYAGQQLHIGGTTATVHSSVKSYSAPKHQDTAVAESTPSHSGGYSSGSLSDIPGVPSSFAACVAYRESTNLENPAARGNAYGIIPSSGYNGYAMSLSQQKQTFSKLYSEYGKAPWSPSDGC